MTGTAGWSIPRAVTAQFPGSGTHLERYAQVLPCAEINSSFYRPHAQATYARWAASTPTGFKFSVKVPKAITHVLRLRDANAPLQKFCAEIGGLGEKLGPLLVQLPPKLTFNADVAHNFFAALRKLYNGAAVCEPRHPSWWDVEATALLTEFRIGRVAADPAIIAAAAQPGGWMGSMQDRATAIIYYRLHGAPRVYWSRYDQEQLQHWAAELRSLPDHAENWIIFDNTAAGCAIENALEFKKMAASTVHEEVPRIGYD
ncbi:MAG: DUF72 domain-containing protein [Pseudomonadota bacterium]